jgi:hypothetical protein
LNLPLTKRELAWSALLASALVGAMYFKVVHLWWLSDDFWSIHFFHDHPGLGYFVSSIAWTGQRLFTPFQFLSFQLDLVVFGLRPELFYLHQLVSLVAAVVCLYGLLRLWLSRITALLAMVMVILGPPMVSWVVELLNRHYVEGLVFATLSTWCFVKSVRGNRPGLAGASALLYLFAMLEKEVYIPLVVLLLFLPEKGLRPRVRRASLHWVSLVAYLSWRYAILGTVLGGYGWAIRNDELLPLILALPGKMGAALLGQSPFWNAVLILILGLCIAASVQRSFRPALLLLVAIALILLPLVGASKAFRPRYAGLAWVTIVVAFGFGVEALMSRGRDRHVFAGLIAALAVVAALKANRNAWQGAYARAERGSVEGRAFLEMKDRELLRNPEIPPAAMHHLKWMKETLLGGPKGAGWFDDDLYVCRSDSLVQSVKQYDLKDRSVVDVTARLPEIRSRYLAALRTAPLRAAFWRAGDAYYWDLGPYERGQYSLVIDHGIERFDVQRMDGYRINALVITLQVRYEAPEGWVAFSPDLPIDMRGGQRFHWEGIGEAVH